MILGQRVSGILTDRVYSFHCNLDYDRDVIEGIDFVIWMDLIPSFMFIQIGRQL